jgi:hypothetical protein
MLVLTRGLRHSEPPGRATSDRIDRVDHNVPVTRMRATTPHLSFIPSCSTALSMLIFLPSRRRRSALSFPGGPPPSAPLCPPPAARALLRSSLELAPANDVSPPRFPTGRSCPCPMQCPLLWLSPIRGIRGGAWRLSRRRPVRAPARSWEGHFSVHLGVRGDPVPNNVALVDV